MGQINRIPVGYLDLVGTETGGKNPSNAPEVVSPTISMDQFYAAQTLRSQNFATNNTAVGNNNFIEVPAGESWIVYSVSADVIQPTSTDLDSVVVALRSLPRADSAAATASIANFLLDGIAGGDHPVDTTRFPVPFILTSGIEVIAEISGRVGGAANRVVNISLLTGVLRG